MQPEAKEWPPNADFRVSERRKAPLYSQPGGSRVAVAPRGTLLHGIAEPLTQVEDVERLWLRIDLAEENPLRASRGFACCWAAISDSGRPDLIDWEGPIDADILGGALHLKWSPPFSVGIIVAYEVDTRIEGAAKWNPLWRRPAQLEAAPQVHGRGASSRCVQMQVAWPHASSRASVRIVARAALQHSAAVKAAGKARAEGAAIAVGSADSVAPQSAWMLSSAITICGDVLDRCDAGIAVPGIESGRVVQLWPPPQPERPAVLTKVLWMNLERRPDRASTQRNSLDRAGLARIAERFTSVDGSALDLNTIDERILTESGRQEAMVERGFVLGSKLTRGAVGLWLTWHRVLTHIAESGNNHTCFLVVEDDAEYTNHFCESLDEVLLALDMRDRAWTACVVGYIRSKTRLRPLFGDRPSDASDSCLDTIIGLPAKLCGAAAVLVHGSAGAAALLQELFPVGARSQFDTLLGTKEKLCYITTVPLASAPLSEAGDTDIQHIPEDKRERLRLEAEIRQQLGDSVLAPKPELADIIGMASFTEELLGYLRQHACDLSRGQDQEVSGVSPEDCQSGGPIPDDLLHEVARGVGAYAAQRNMGRVLPKVQGNSKVEWSSAGPFSLVGNWDAWDDMHPMVATPEDGAFYIVVPVLAGEIFAEFQIVFDGDWARRFCPQSMEPFSAPIGPADLHGQNWRAAVPDRQCKSMHVLWNPCGMRSLVVTFKS